MENVYLQLLQLVIPYFQSNCIQRCILRRSKDYAVEFSLQSFDLWEIIQGCGEQVRTKICWNTLSCWTFNIF